MKLTACPLDCFDSCVIDYSQNSIKPFKDDLHTGKFLCSHMNHFEATQRLEKPTFMGEEVSMEEALNILTKILKDSEANKTLYFKGHANMGEMQNITKEFFREFEAVNAKGSICAGSGDKAIELGRGSNYTLPLDAIKSSEVVVLWGRNPHDTNSHILPLLKNKKIIVIDPRVTTSAQNADLHIQIKPLGDLVLALLLARFAVVYDQEDKEFLKEFTQDSEDFFDLTQNIRIKQALFEIDATLPQIGEFLDLVKHKKTVFLVGTGVQRHIDGVAAFRAIDSLAATLGLFGKDGCGVGYLSNPQVGIKSAFKEFKNNTTKANVNFSEYETVFIQGANPLSQLPNSLKVTKDIQKCENVIYFGTFENETSKVATLVIPAKHFLEKNDIRFSYGSERVTILNKLKESNIGISEYDLTLHLCEKFDYKINSEKYYLNYFKEHIQEYKRVKKTQYTKAIPYEDGFDTASGKFEFLDEIDFEHDFSWGMNLIYAKSKNSLNSQFKREQFAYINANHGWDNGEEVILESKYGTLKIVLKHDNTLRPDTLLLYSGTPGANNLTNSKVSYEANSAVYQGIKINILRIIND
ncbi:MAG: molybdopterin-dependent oxidoreductase [Helicobacteraceae bacterium]|nr:molybdopterin-dependent oxidoreductase [Helicobacteraceae bacterium]